MLSFCSIVILHRPALYYGFRTDVEDLPISRVFDYFNEKDFESGTRFYATPSNQLIYTYYTGLPIQSTVPVRKSFFDTYPGSIVIFDTRTFPIHVDPSVIEEKGIEQGKTVSDDAIKGIQRAVWRYMVYQHDLSKGLPVANEAPVLTSFEQSILNDAKAYSERYEQYEINKIKRYPIFDGVEASSLDEYWTIFFIRFVDEQNMVQQKLNYYDRVKYADVEYLARSNIVVYESSSLKQTE